MVQGRTIQKRPKILFKLRIRRKESGRLCTNDECERIRRALQHILQYAAASSFGPIAIDSSRCRLLSDNARRLRTRCSRRKRRHSENIVPAAQMTHSRGADRFSIGSPKSAYSAHTESLARPLRRRRVRIRRPSFVLSRARKPCVRARFFFFGWYVRFIRHTIPFFQQATTIGHP